MGGPGGDVVEEDLVAVEEDCIQEPFRSRHSAHARSVQDLQYLPPRQLLPLDRLDHRHEVREPGGEVAQRVQQVRQRPRGVAHDLLLRLYQHRAVHVEDLTHPRAQRTHVQPRVRVLVLQRRQTGQAAIAPPAVARHERRQHLVVVPHAHDAVRKLLLRHREEVHVHDRQARGGGLEEVAGVAREREEDLALHGNEGEEWEGRRVCLRRATSGASGAPDTNLKNF